MHATHRKKCLDMTWIEKVTGIVFIGLGTVIIFILAVAGSILAWWDSNGD